MVLNNEIFINLIQEKYCIISIMVVNCLDEVVTFIEITISLA